MHRKLSSARGSAIFVLGAVFLAACSSEPPAATVATSSPTTSDGRTSTLPTPTPSLTPSFQRGGVAGVAGTPPPRAKVRDGSGGLVATRLRSDPGCDGARAFMNLAWRPANQRGSEQRVAVSARSDGFETGAYRVSGALPSADDSFRLRDVQSGGVYYWRILTKHGDRYDGSTVETLEGRPCTADSG